jgi:DNA-binding beta-propeller fold protein YncE
MHPSLAIVLLLLACVAPAWGAEEATIKPAQTIPLPGVEGRIDHMAIDSKRHRLYIAALENNSLEVIDLAKDKRIRSIPGLAKPAGVRAVQASGDVIVACGGDGTVRLFDEDLALRHTVDQLPDADNVRLDPLETTAYVGFGEGAIAILDTAALMKGGEIKLDGHPESFQLETDGPRIFVNVPSAGHVAVLDRKERTTIARFPLKQAKGNFPLALDGGRLLIACREPAKLLELNARDGKVIAAVDCCGDADDLFVDSGSKRIYLTGGEGCISVINADLKGPTEKIPTAPGARTSLYDPTTKTLYVAVPHRGEQRAELRVYPMTQK